MKFSVVKIIAAAFFAAIAASPDRAAGDDFHASTSGHWAWVVEPVVGPKSAAPSHRHMWIPDRELAPFAENGTGRWQWVSEASFGPRAGAPVRHRVWISTL